MANETRGRPRCGGTEGLGAALRDGAARGAGPVELEGMARGRLHAFLARELRRGLAGATGLLAVAWRRKRRRGHRIDA